MFGCTILQVMRNQEQGYMHPKRAQGHLISHKAHNVLMNNLINKHSWFYRANSQVTPVMEGMW